METEYKPTLKIAQKVLETVDKGLVKGLGMQVPGKMCIEAAVCFAFGLPHNDKPPCVGKTVRDFKIALNDCDWPTDADRTKGMRELSVAQLGSDTIDQKKFLEKVGFKCIKNILPVILENSLNEDKDHKYFKEKINAEELVAVIKELRALKSYKKAKVVADKAWKIYYASASASASAYASAYASASASAYASAYVYAYAKKNPIFHLKILNLTAQAGLEALKELKSPGCKWLHLCK